MKYQTIASFQEYDVIEPYEPVRSPVWEREERNRKRKKERKAVRDGYIMAAIMATSFIMFIVLWLMGV